MGIDIERRDTTPNACLLCGKRGQHETRFAVISANCTYSVPQPVTPLGTSVRQMQPLDRKIYSHSHGLAIWEMHICPGCLPKSWVSYLHKSIRTALGWALLNFLIFLLGLAGMIWGKEILGPPSQGDNRFIFIWFVVGIIVGAIVAFAYARKVLSGWKTLRGITQNILVPAEWVDKCFKGEAEKILTQLVNARKKGKTGASKIPLISVESFPLPAFKGIEQFSDEAYARVAALEKELTLGGELNRTDKWIVVAVWDKENIENRLEQLVQNIRK